MLDMILYIAKREPHNLGANTHLHALKDIFGKENVFQIDLLRTEHIERENYISFGYDGRNIVKRTARYLQGNINFVTDAIIEKICNVILSYRINLVFSEESDLGKLYKTIKNRFPHIQIVCFFHDISHDLFKGRIKNTPKWKIHYILECYRVISQEKMALKYIDKSIVFHQADAERYYAVYGRKPDYIIPLCLERVDLNNKPETGVTKADEKKKILFVCSSYYVNISGFLWFYKNVFKKLDGDFKVLIVGTGTAKFESTVRDKKIEMIGKVESLAKYYQNADIVIAPVFEGGGMKMKTIEAFSFGKCLVSTSESLHGYWEVIPETLKNKLIFKCDTAQQWIDACNTLLKNDIRKCNEEIISVVKDNFSYETLVERFRYSLIGRETLKKAEK